MKTMILVLALAGIAGAQTTSYYGVQAANYYSRTYQAQGPWTSPYLIGASAYCNAPHSGQFIGVVQYPVASCSDTIYREDANSLHPTNAGDCSIDQQCPITLNPPSYTLWTKAVVFDYRTIRRIEDNDYWTSCDVNGDTKLDYDHPLNCP